MDLTDEQWEVIRPLLPHRERPRARRGRPWQDPRAVLNGVLWIGEGPERLPYKAEINGQNRLEARIHLYETGK